MTEFKQLADGSKPVTQAEIKRARDYAIGSLVLSLEDSENVAQFFGMKQVLTRQVIEPSQVIKQLQAVTVDQVQQLAKELVVNGQMRLAVVGPIKAEDIKIFG